MNGTRQPDRSWLSRIPAANKKTPKHLPPFATSVCWQYTKGLGRPPFGSFVPIPSPLHFGVSKHLQEGSTCTAQPVAANKPSVVAKRHHSWVILPQPRSGSNSPHATRRLPRGWPRNPNPK